VAPLAARKVVSTSRRRPSHQNGVATAPGTSSPALDSDGGPGVHAQVAGPSGRTRGVHLRAPIPLGGRCL